MRPLLSTSLRVDWSCSARTSSAGFWCTEAIPTWVRLAQKYDPDVPGFLIKDYVPEAAGSPGDWSAVTFDHVLDMATGNYRSSGFMVDEEHWDTDPFWNEEHYAEKIAAAFNWPHSADPGTQWVYRAFDTFITSGAKNVVGIQPWESHQFGTVEITGVPATHLTVTVGFVIQGEGRQVYFAGDTFYCPFMERIGQRFQLDVALMPVTTYRIPMTMGEKSAVRAVRDLEPDYVIPIHLGVVPRSPLLRTSHTPEGFMRRLHEAGLDVEVILLKKGERWTL